MTASDVQAGTWAPCGPPFSSYEAWSGGAVRSVDRTVKGRRYKSTVLAERPSSRGYPQVNVVDDDGKVQTVAVHVLVMLAHEGPCPAGLQVRHWNDDQADNRWAPGGEAACRRGEGNLIYGTPKQNAADKIRNKIEIIPLEPKAIGYRTSRRRQPGRARTAARNAVSRLRRWFA